MTSRRTQKVRKTRKVQRCKNAERYQAREAKQAIDRRASHMREHAELVAIQGEDYEQPIIASDLPKPLRTPRWPGDLEILSDSEDERWAKAHPWSYTE